MPLESERMAAAAGSVPSICAVDVPGAATAWVGIHASLS